MELQRDVTEMEEVKDKKSCRACTLSKFLACKRDDDVLRAWRQATRAQRWQKERGCRRRSYRQGPGGVSQPFGHRKVRPWSNDYQLWYDRCIYVRR